MQTLFCYDLVEHWSHTNSKRRMRPIVNLLHPSVGQDSCLLVYLATHRIRSACILRACTNASLFLVELWKDPLGIKEFSMDHVLLKKRDDF